MRRNMRQPRFPCMKSCRPPKPTFTSERVATAIARRLVAEVNLDEFYWEADEIEERILDVRDEIMRAGRPTTVFTRLWKRQPPVSCNGERGAHPYGWDGIDEHCRAIADGIAEEELQAAIKWWRERYA